MTVVGTSGDDDLSSGGQDVVAFGGNDIIRGSTTTAATYYGGTGNDRYIISLLGDSIIEYNGEGTDTIETALPYYRLANDDIQTLAIEFLVGTSNGGQSLVGNSFTQVIDGGLGNDELQGLGGDDFYVVRNAGDTIVEQAGGGDDTILTGLASYALTAANVENLTGTSNAGQSLVGNAQANRIEGGTGNDELIGGAGNDTYFVLNSGDTIVEQSGQGTDMIIASANYTLSAGQDIETLRVSDPLGTTAVDLVGNDLNQSFYGNNGANLLSGNGGADNLSGFGGDDILLGGDGDDVINGEAGLDVLNGGAGADTFVFGSALSGSNVDGLQDFVSGQDRIQLDQNVFTGLSAGALSSSQFVVGSAARDADDRIVYNSANGYLSFDADGNGAGVAVLFAILSGHPPLVASDFAVF